MQFKYLKTKSTVPSNLKRKDWGLEIPLDVDWDKKKKRVLFVVDHVASNDLKEKRLLSGDTATMFLNVVRHAHKVAGDWGHPTNKSKWAYAFANFNFFHPKVLTR